jgi:hypothetical protein
LLWHGVEIDQAGSDPQVARALRYLATGARHQPPQLATMHYRVVALDDGGLAGGGPWRVDEEGDHLDTVADPESVLDLVYRRVHQRAFELASLRGWVRLHAATVDLDTHRVGDPVAEGSGPPVRRVLLVAPSGTGKTTLACRLLFDGQAVGADESTLVREGRSLPVARRFHLKPGAEAVVAELDAHLDGLPGLVDGSVRAFDPSEAGFAWTIAERPVDHVVLVDRLARARGGTDPPGELVPASAVEVMPELVDQSFPHQEPTGALLAQVAALLRQARCWRLRMGAIDQASILVRGLAHE